MDYTRHTNCRYCQSDKLHPILDLGSHPPSDSFILPDQIKDEKRFPLELFYCENCCLLQILDTVSPELLFGGEFLYQASTSRALVNHYASLTEKITDIFDLKANDAVMDIGCNDGILLNTYKVEGLRSIGVEPSELAPVAASHGHTVYNEFFNSDCADKILAEHGNVKIVTATNVFPHVEGITEFLLGVKKLIGDSGVFIIEASYMPDFIDQILFDTIYHEHLCYLSLTPVNRFMQENGMEVFDLERAAIGASGPAIRFYVQKQGGAQAMRPSVDEFLTFEKEWGVGNLENYQNFANRVKNAKTSILGILDGFRKDNVELGGYGAPAKGNTMLNYLGVDDSVVSYIADNSELKQGKLTPGSHIPVVSDEEFLDNNPSHALLLAWNYLDFFLKNSDYIKNGGKFIVPLPTPEIRP